MSADQYLKSLGLSEVDYGELEKPYQGIINSFNNPRQPAVEPSGLTGTLKDVGISALKGAVAVPESAVGLADLATGGRAGKALQGVGFRPADARNYLDSLYSPEQQAANRAVQQADGFIPTLGALAENPSVIPHTAIESLPLMLGGQGLAQGAMRLAPKLSPLAAGAFGEGAVTAGSQAEQVRQGTDNSLLTGKQAALAGGSGVLTGAITGGSGAVANKLGLGDINQLFLGKQAAEKTPGLIPRIAGSGAAEAGQEAIQSGQEQAATNLALDKPIGEGVGQSAALGAVTGFGLGGLSGIPGKVKVSPVTGQPVPELQPDSGPLTKAVNANATEVQNAPLQPTSPIGNNQPTAGTDQPVEAGKPGTGFDAGTGQPGLVVGGTDRGLGGLAGRQDTVGRELGVALNGQEELQAPAVDPLTQDDRGATEELYDPNGVVQSPGLDTKKPLADFSPTHEDSAGYSYQATDNPEIFQDQYGDEWVNNGDITPIKKPIQAKPDEKTQDIYAQQERAAIQADDTQDDDYQDNIPGFDTVSSTKEQSNPVLSTDKKQKLESGDNKKLPDTYKAYQDKIIRTNIPKQLVLEKLEDAKDAQGNPTGWKSFESNSYVSIINPKTRESYAYRVDLKSGTDKARARVVIGNLAADLAIVDKQTPISVPTEKQASTSGSDEIKPLSPSTVGNNAEVLQEPVKVLPSGSTSSISDGERAYNEDLKAKPTYDDGTPRKPWNELSNAVKQSWEKNPTPKHVQAAPNAGSPNVPEANFGDKQAPFVPTHEDSQGVKYQATDTPDEFIASDGSYWSQNGDIRPIKEPTKKPTDSTKNAGIIPISPEFVQKTPKSIQVAQDVQRKGEKVSTFKPGKFTIPKGNSIYDKEDKEISGYISGSLAVHKAIGKGNKYDISHTNTGRRIVGDFPSLSAAKEAATRINAEHDLSGITDKISLSGYPRLNELVTLVAELSGANIKKPVISTPENLKSGKPGTIAGNNSGEVSTPSTQPDNVSMKVENKDISVADYGKSLGLTEEQIDDAIIGKQVKAKTPYLSLMNEIRKEIEDRKAAITKPSSQRDSVQKAYRARLNHWDMALETLNASEREYINPFSPKVAASKAYKPMPAHLEKKFAKKFDGIETGEKARLDKYKSETEQKKALLDAIVNQPKPEKTSENAKNKENGEKQVNPGKSGQIGVNPSNPVESVKIEDKKQPDSVPKPAPEAKAEPAPLNLQELESMLASTEDQLSKQTYEDDRLVSKANSIRNAIAGLKADKQSNEYQTKADYGKKQDTTGGRDNERNDTSGGSKRVLEAELPKPIPENDTGKATGRGSASRGQDDAARDRNADGGRDTDTGRGVGSKTDSPASKTREPLERELEKEDFYISDDSLGEGTYGQRLAANMAAIRLVKQLEKENRLPTQDEKGQLSQFVGWGALKNVFNPDSKSKQDREAYKELQTLLNKNEMFWAGQGVLAQHFTSPEVIDGIYSVLKHMGFKGGNVLEPTVGVGNFIGKMPLGLKASSTWHGSEIDPIAGKITEYLYPEANILAGTGFQKAEFPYNTFDLTIGNPPFGDERITDKVRKDINRFKIHNYIIAKSAMHLKPGGAMAFVVTNRFLDTRDDEARAMLAKNFSLLAAIRLPNTAFKKNAGTEVTTDIIFLRKNLPGEDQANKNWLDTNGTIKANGETIRLNKYFADNPDMMLGTPSMKGTMYGNGEQFTLNPHPGQDIKPQIERLIAEKLVDVANVLQNNETLDAQSAPIKMNRNDVALGGYIAEDGKILMRQDDDENGNQVFTELSPETPWTEKTKLGVKRYGRIKGMLGLRELAYRLVNAERADAKDIEVLRKMLNARYDAFVKEHGFINHPENTRLFSSDVKIEFGLEKNYKPAISAAKAKSSGLVQAKDFAEKADLLKQRLFYPYKEITSAKNPKDGYSISMSEKGRLDLDYIAKLTGLSRDEVIADLSSGDLPLIYQDPVSKEWVQEDDYLSGNVKRKLREAKAHTGYDKNVKNLEAVQPVDLKTEEIFADLGQTWITKEAYEDFLTELGVSTPFVAIDTYTGNVSATKFGTVTATALGKQFENQDYSIPDLFTLIANKKAIVAYDVTKDSKTVNQERTKVLQNIAKRFTALFRDWIFADSSRAEQLTAIYNETQNTTVKREFAGKHLKTVGANPSFKLRDTQKNAAWRMIQSPSVLLDHVVGAGKTATLITGIMERRRLGISKKPALIVPNHLVSQWNKEFMELYPGANILAASEKDFAKANRRKLFSRIATGDYDAIIMGHSSFKFIGIEKENEEAFIQDEIKSLEDSLAAAEENEDKRSVRAIKNRIAKRHERIDALNSAPKDSVATFEQMGIDYLGVDESHEFKNLEYSTGMRRVAGMGNPNGSQRAFDLYMKMGLLLDNGKGGVAFATGTPISNSLVEMYSIMRYLNKNGLKDRKIESFDAWAKNYASIDSVIEYTATQKLKERSIMGSFNNIPEMMQLYNEFADVVTMDDLKRIYSEQIKKSNAEKNLNERTEFPVPKVKGGGRQLVTVEPSAQQIEYMDYLIERSLNLETDMKSRDFDPKKDNLLWVYNDAKKAALDMRLVDPEAPDNPDSKVNRAVDNVYKTYQKWHKDKGTQLIFSDMSTPKKSADKKAISLIKAIYKELDISSSSTDFRAVERLERYQDKWLYLKNKIDAEMEDENTSGDRVEALQKFLDSIEEDLAAFVTVDTGFSVYDDIKNKLVKKGIPAEEIHFIHDYNTAKEKEQLFALVNRGDVRVLLGSTQKMGAGTNAQERLVALHHIDTAQHARPSDIEQREGRIIRQGNKLFARDPDNFEVEITAYSTGRTFDAVSWQTLAKKASMLESFRSGARTIEEGKGDAAGYLEFMAETTGNPIFREKVKLEGEISDLEADERRLQTQLSVAQRIVNNADKTVKALENSIDKITKAVNAIGKADSFELNGKTYKNDIEAISAEEWKQYRKEHEKHFNEMKVYSEKREEWEKLGKDSDRGKAPSKPKEPEAPTLFSARMKAKSKGAQFLDDLKQAIADLTDDGMSVAFKIGNLGFTAEHESKRNFAKELESYISITDDYNVINAYRAFNHAQDYLSGKFINDFSPGEYQFSKKAQETKLDRAEKEIKASREYLANNQFSDSKELAAKRARFEEVKAIVDSFEAEEADRRQEKQNKYIALDSRRFPSGTARERAKPATVPEEPKFSKSQPSTGLTTSEIISQLPSYAKKMMAEGKLKVVQSVKDLPSNLQKRGNALLSVPAWHGSPHDHDRFDSSNIGTGEGAQAFGYGLYFTSSKEIADWYSGNQGIGGASVPTFYMLNGKKTQSGTPEQKAADLIYSTSLAKAKSLAKSMLSDAKKGQEWTKEKGVEYYQGIFDIVNSVKSKSEVKKAKGNLYQVELAPEQDEFLDWDKPLSGQSEKVRNALSKAGFKEIIKPKPYTVEIEDDNTFNVKDGNGRYLPVSYATKKEAQEAANNLTKQAIENYKSRERDGFDIYNSLKDKTNDVLGKKASDYLHSLGIRGIRYKAEGGRGDASNYVIFSDQDVKITAKYSQQLANIEGLFDGKSIHLVADALNSNNLKAVLNHEIFHYSLATNPKTRQIVDTFNKKMAVRFGLALKGIGSQAEIEAAKRVQSANTPKADQVEEWQAYLISEFQKPTNSLGAAIKKLISEFLAAIRVQMLKLGLPLRELTPADLNALAIDGVKYQANYLGLPNSSRAMASVSPNTDNIKYSIASDARDKLPDWGKNAADKIAQEIQDRFANDRTFNWLERNIATQSYKAWKDKDYKPVFDSSVAYEQSTARLANEAADLAPSLLPKLEGLKESLAEVKNGRKRTDDAEKIGRAIMDTTLQEKPMTDAELSRAGYTPDQITMYHEFYAAVNKSLDDAALSEMVRMAKSQDMKLARSDMSIQEAAKFYADQAEKPEDKAAFIEKAYVIQELKDKGYAPLSRYGQYTVAVYDGDGKTPIYFGMHESLKEANQEARQMRELYPRATVKQGILSQNDWQLFRGVTPETMQVFAKMMGIDQDKAFQEYYKLALSNQSAMKKLIHRKKVEGYSLDTQRILSTFITSNARHSAKNMHMGDMLNAIANIPKEKGDVRDEAVGLYDFVQNPNTAGAGARNVLFAWYLGGSIAAAGVNLTQTFTTTFPALHRLGSAKEVAAILPKAMKMAANPGAITGNLAKALKRSEEEGITAPHELAMLYQESMRTGFTNVAKQLRPIAKFWGSFFSLAEAYNRRVAFIAAYTMAKGTPEQKFAEAEQMVLDTQFQYSKSARSSAARSAIGSTVFTFKTFTINYIEFLKKLPMKERAIALGVLMLMAGASGLPGADDADDIIDTIGQSMGYNINSKAWKDRYINHFLLYGLSAFLPIDISSRLGVGNLIPGSAIFKRSETDKSRDVMEFIGPMGSLAKNAIEAYDVASGRQGVLPKLTAMKDVLLPKALSDMVKAFDMASDGVYKDTRGYKVVETTPLDAAAKLIGFQPEKVAEARRPERFFRQYKELAVKTESEIADLWAKGIFDKDIDKVKEARALLTEWNIKNPDTPIRINQSQLLRRVKEMRNTSSGRLLKHAPKELRGFGSGLLN